MIKRDSPKYATLEKLALGAVLAEEASDSSSEASETKVYVVSHLRLSDFHNKYACDTYQWALDQIAADRPTSYTFVPDTLCGYASSCVIAWSDMYGKDKNIKAICDDMARISDVYFAYGKAKELFETMNRTDDMHTAHIVQQLREIADGTAARHPEVVEDVVNVADALHSYMSLWGRLSPRMSFGLPLVDATIRGFRAPNVVVIAGRTNTGKSAIWIPIAIENAKKGRRVLICSTEMDRNAMTKRMLANIGGIKMNSLDDIEDGNMDMAILNDARIKQAYADLHALPITMNDKCKTVGEIDELCKQAESNGHPYALIIIDYIQLLHPTKTFIQKGEIPMSIVSGEMISLSKGRNVGVIALSQLSRAAMAEGKEPELHHLAQSGSLENDADMVFLMWRPKPEDPKHIELILAKNRHGGYGRWHMQFEGEVMRYFSRSEK